MGVSDRVAALAVRRLHLLVVSVAGWDFLRMRVQAAARKQGWVLVSAPADADVLVTVGLPDDEQTALIERSWDQVAAPRWRVTITDPGEIDGAFREAVDALRDLRWQRAHDEQRGARPDEGVDDQEHARSGGDASPSDHDVRGDMDMSMDGPAGIPLAGGFEDDRDGLEMDVLHLPLGPVLTDWPAGLVLECVLSGDVVVKASARLLPAATAPAPDEEMSSGIRQLARHLDAAAQVLRLASWPAAADRTVRVLDVVLGGAAPASVAKQVGALHRRVVGSRLLAWTLGHRRGGSSEPTIERLCEHLAAARAITEGRSTADPCSMGVDEFAAAVRGRGISEVRLLAAGMVLRPAGSAVHHG